MGTLGLAPANPHPLTPFSFIQRSEHLFIVSWTVVRTLSLLKKPCSLFESLSEDYLILLFPPLLSDFSSHSSSFSSLSVLNASPILCSLNLPLMDRQGYIPINKENSLPKTLIQSNGCNQLFVFLFLFLFFFK